MEKRRLTPPTSPVTRSSRKIRNEFIARPGHRTLMSTKWVDAHESKGWIVLIAVLLSMHLLRIFYQNSKLHNSLISTEGGNFLFRIFLLEIGEFATVILLIYFFSFIAFVAEWVMAKFDLSRKPRAVLIASVHLIYLAFIGVIIMYLLQRKYEVSFSYRFAVAAQLFVMYMKSVSYLGTNNFLWKLKKSGDRSIHPDLAPFASDLDVGKLSLDEVASLLSKRGIDVTKLATDPRDVLTQLVGLDTYRKTVYPENVTVINFIEFTCLPVLVYEPRYPRTSRLNLVAIVEKIIIAFGLFMFDWFLVEHYILPICAGATEDTLVSSIIDLAIPMQLFFVCTFYLTFECLLGLSAEVMKLADREFYSDWWNSTTFEEFSRKWNKPVHEFLLRHVHMEIQALFGVSSQIATIFTFLYSIIAHEIVLLGMFGIFRPYLAFFSMFQIPLWHCMRSPIFRNRLLGNIVFWSSLTVAYTLILILFCKDYCREDVRNCTLH
jgi:hypothetical protein